MLCLRLTYLFRPGYSANGHRKKHWRKVSQCWHDINGYMLLDDPSSSIFFSSFASFSNSSFIDIVIELIGWETMSNTIKYTKVDNSILNFAECLQYTTLSFQSINFTSNIVLSNCNEKYCTSLINSIYLIIHLLLSFSEIHCMEKWIKVQRLFSH